MGRQQAFDRYGFQVGQEARDFRNFQQRYQSDADAFTRALLGHRQATGDTTQQHLVNAGLRGDEWNRYFQTHQLNEGNRLAGHQANIYGFSSYVDPLLRLYAIQRGGLPGYYPTPMPPYPG